MKKHNIFNYLNKVLVIALSVLIIACSQFEETPSNPTLDSSESLAAWKLQEMNQNRFNATVTVVGTASEPISAGGNIPYIIAGANPGGNRTCAEVATATGLSFALSSGKLDYDGGTFKNDDGSAGSWPAGFTVTVTDGKFVSWSYSKPNYRLVNVALIVKGSDAANIYAYAGPSSDSGLASPLNNSGRPADLSNLTICYTEEIIPTPCTENQTAWAGLNINPAGQRYTTKGNWAYWVTRMQLQNSVTVWAGQHINVGTAVLRNDNRIEITLINGWKFKSGENVENVKIEFYTSAPSGNPSPGRFRYKNTAEGSSYVSGVVPANASHFGIHLDVEKSIPCEQ